MKILAIRGRNLASLAGDFEIDFTKEPLSSAGIFAITGCTGSGKSTLLDAMCIALYATSPRIKKINSKSDLIDTGNNTLNEDDSRNILRKGASNGYAEVDFKALDNKIYRATWSVRRARDSKSGKMQEAEISLLNLTDNCKADGKKRETLAKIAELTGLTYEQFTRAVLLAQGDFATFLKADKKEKAEILEKLTGTDIYSKISEKIFNCHKQAASEVRILEEKIKEATLLTDEEKEELLQEKKRLENDIQKTEQEIKELEKKKSWIEQHEKLSQGLHTATEEYDSAKEQAAATKNTAERLALIDSVQDVRDTYMSAISLHNDKTKYQKQTEKENADLLKLEEMLADAKKEVDENSDKQEKKNGEWLKIQPKIKEAQSIEGDCRNAARKLKELEEERSKTQSSLTTQQSEADILRKNIAKNEKELADIETWFAAHKIYSAIIPKKEIVIANIKDIASTEKQIADRRKLLSDAEKLLTADEERLKRTEQEAEELNRILPEEIVALRKRLVEGEPCPVCGSRHHQISTTEEKTLKEEMLIQAKKEVQEKTEQARKSIEADKNAINSHRAYIESSIAGLKNCTERNNEILAPLQGTVGQFDEAFAARLENIALQWSDNQAAQAEITSARAVNNAKLATADTRIKETEAELAKKIKECDDCATELAEKKKKITELIGEDCSAEDITERYNKEISSLNELVAASIEKRTKILVAYEKLLGSIEQVKKSLKAIEEEQERAKKIIEKFLNERSDRLTLPGLHELITTGSDEVAQMRAAVERQQKRMLAAETTLSERKKAMEEHRKAPCKPNDGETMSEIETAIATLDAQKKAKFDRMSEIGFKLKLNEENTKTVNRDRQAYDEKKEILTSWTILNEAFGSATGDKFKIIAQGYTLDILLEYANKHLEDISRRYRLARISTDDSLGIKVIDTDMMNEERSVHSLSGGETFLVSLALALALSSLSSNKMSIESLFIDEGFGALDNDTLHVAMDALESLQGQGRKVGVISHLQDIIERIPTKIKIEKEAEGRSKVNIEFS